VRRLVVADAVRTAAGVLGDALLLDGDRVVAAGREDALAGPAIETIRHRGVIVPALEDAHLHPGALAASSTGASLGAPPDFDAIRSVLSERAAALPAAAPLTASGLDEHRLAEGRLPHREELDGMVPDRPVLLHRVCGHVAVANTAALEAAGMGPGTPDPEGGSIERDASGRPTGVLRETAIDLVSSVVRDQGPGPGALGAVLDRLAGSGIGSIGAMVPAGSPHWCGIEDELAAFAGRAGALPLDVRVFVMTSDPAALETAAGLLRSPTGDLSFGGWKGFADGSFGGHTAALRLPYADRPGTSGLVRLDRTRDRVLAETALGLGGGVAMHAIGDRAVSEALDLFSDLLRGGADPGALRIEHASLLDEELIARIAELGVVASIQPAFVASDAAWLPDRVGPERSAHVYPFRALADAGIVLVGGSDAPVEDPDPWAGMAAARHRAGFHPEQALDGAEALALFTGGTGRARSRLAPVRYPP
jgi:predicted amidohydrolase YtcJ